MTHDDYDTRRQFTTRMHVQQSSSPQCKVTICCNDVAVLDTMHVPLLRRHCDFWTQYPQVSLAVQWNRDGGDKTTVVLCSIAPEADTTAQLDALRREAKARRNYQSPRDLDSVLLNVPSLLLRQETLRHSPERVETVWLVGGSKQCFTAPEPAVEAARTALSEWLLRYGTNFYVNAFAVEAREALPVVWTELPVNFSEDLGTVVPYLAERMREEVAARIRARSQTPQESRRW